MALIIYPTTGWDSYVSLADAEILVTNNIITTTSWNALTNTQKELYLKQSSLDIRLHIEDPLALTTPYDLQLAVVFLSVNSIGKDMWDSDGKSNIKRIEISGAITKEYFTKGKDSNSYPDIVEALLAQFIYSGAGTFSLNRA